MSNPDIRNVIERETAVAAKLVKAAVEGFYQNTGLVPRSIDYYMDVVESANKGVESVIVTRVSFNIQATR